MSTLKREVGAEKARKAKSRCDAGSKKAIAFSRDAKHGVSTVTTMQSHGWRARTWKRRPTPSIARGNAQIKKGTEVP